jgi:hypothetical protein
MDFILLLTKPRSSLQRASVYRIIQFLLHGLREEYAIKPIGMFAGLLTPNITDDGVAGFWRLPDASNEPLKYVPMMPG